MRTFDYMPVPWSPPRIIVRSIVALQDLRKHLARERKLAARRRALQMPKDDALSRLRLELLRRREHHLMQTLIERATEPSRGDWFGEDAARRARLAAVQRKIAELDCTEPHPDEDADAEAWSAA